MKTLSIVVPVFNEEPCVHGFCEAVFALSLDCALEVVFVDDGSTDGTLARVKERAAADPRVRFVSFSRNFGKEAALVAGLRHATGDFVVTMDVDLQHDPNLLKPMLEALTVEGYDSAAACRTTRRGEPAVRSWFAHRFYALMNRYSDVALKDGAMDYRMMTRPVVEAVLSLKESNRFTKGIYEWVGFRTKWIACENLPRTAGASKWNVLSLFAYSLRGILAFSTAPLSLASLLGFLTTCAAFAYLIWVMAKWIILGDPVSGWPTLVCLILFLGGLQLFVIGILGLYLAGVFRETKARPLYFIREQR